MTNIDQVVELLLIHFGLDENKVLKESTKVFPGIKAGALFKSLVVTSNLKSAAELLDCSDRTIQRVLRELFSPKSERGGSQRQYLLEFIQHKYCANCDRILTLDSFNTDKSKCKECIAERFSRYYDANKHEIINRITIRNTLKISRIPKWVDIAKIQAIYKNCPEGHHVDHIVPLQGKTVCGLHVENNLQYLLAKDNLAKGNKWEVS